MNAKDVVTTMWTELMTAKDPAVIQKARKLGIEIHISTQANISNTASALFYKELGAERVVLARELSLEQIKVIKDATQMQIEAFVHGAMCISVSARCFISQHLHGRSANRGDCIQPCRFHYDVVNSETTHALQIGDGHVLSPKDLCTLPVIDKVIGSGIDCFKIEGRSRSPEYIKTVVTAYRRAIDAVKAGEFCKELCNELMTSLQTVYNRGFSSGFLFGKPLPSDYSDRRGSYATERKIQIGKVLNFYRKSNIAFCEIQCEGLAIGDRLQVHGNKTGVEDMIVSDMRSEDKQPIDSIDKGKITFPSKVILRHNDKLFKIVDVD